MSASNKKRLYLAVYSSYPTGTRHEDKRYRFSFLVGPKHESCPFHGRGLRCCVRRLSSTVWRYDETHVDDARTADDLLARVLIGKVTDEKQLLAILRGTPAQDDADYGWCEEVVTRIANSGKAVTSPPMQDWKSIERTTLAFMCHKRLSKRYPACPGKPLPTWDALRGEEIIH
ncbi:hypothetical protein Hte_005256 [Hypoxylon texense]